MSDGRIDVTGAAGLEEYEGAVLDSFPGTIFPAGDDQLSVTATGVVTQGVAFTPDDSSALLSWVEKEHRSVRPKLPVIAPPRRKLHCFEIRPLLTNSESARCKDGCILGNLSE